MPIISTMPKDNHSVMQLYLDGPKNNFFTFFHVREKESSQIDNNTILSSSGYLRNKDLGKIVLSQKLATEKVFLSQNMPFRSFEIINRNEKTLGELFCFFILETILLGRALNVNPYDQPSVELIKKETKKYLFKVGAKNYVWDAISFFFKNIKFFWKLIFFFFMSVYNDYPLIT